MHSGSVGLSFERLGDATHAPHLHKVEFSSTLCKSGASSDTRRLWKLPKNVSTNRYRSKMKTDSATLRLISRLKTFSQTRFSELFSWLNDACLEIVSKVVGDVT